MKVSIIAAAVRVPFYKTFMDSLKSTSVEYEVVFCGHNTWQEINSEFKGEYFRGHHDAQNIGESEIPDRNFRYIHTAKIKPAQCYEIARREAKGETILWAADDCVFTDDLIGKAYRFWKEIGNEKDILSIQTLENGMFVNMKVHSFFGGQFDTPLMAPLGLMSRQFMEDLGGFDRRFLCGQYENFAVMQAIAAGGKVHIFGDKENMIIIDHYARHGIKRPFATGYNHDREILELCWTDGRGNVLPKPRKPHEPYDEKDLYIKSQSFKGQWE